MNAAKKILRNYLPAAIFVALTAVLLIATVSVSGTSEAETMKITENNIRRAVVTCYCEEGSYPPDIQYLKDNYGLRISDEYAVFYDVFASNIMPDITVLKKDSQ